MAEVLENTELSALRDAARRHACELVTYEFLDRVRAEKRIAAERISYLEKQVAELSKDEE